MPFIFRRMLETIGVQFVLSLIFSSLFYFGLLSQRVGFVAIMMLVCILLNLVYLYICLEGYIVSVEDLKSYFLVNFLVIAILCAGAITMAVLNVEPLYTFLFFPFKFFNAVFRMSKTASAIISSVFLFVYVAVAPIISARKVMSYD